MLPHRNTLPLPLGSYTASLRARENDKCVLTAMAAGALG